MERLWKFVLVGLVALVLAACGLSQETTSSKNTPVGQRPIATATIITPAATSLPATATARPPTATATQVPLPTISGTQAPTVGLVSTGKRKLYLACMGTGSPTVVMDAGLDASSGSWAGVASKIAPVTRVCVYDRANLGRSEKAPTPRTSQDLVDDLRALLANGGVRPPYVMVGHSLGGLNVRLFTSEATEMVAGLVLVDAWHEEQWDRLVNLVPPPSEGEPQAYKDYRVALQNPIQGNEKVDLQKSGAEVRSQRKPFGSMPLIILSHGKPMAEVPPAASPIFELLWSQLQIDMLSLSTNSKRIVATQSGHSIQIDQPQLVIDAVREVVTEIRGR
jgi:pimeloyl-ACP methyl ester carboxylesterase